jgi:hypothetical protein
MCRGGLRRLLVDPDRAGSLADRARRARRQRLLDTFPEIESMCVMDLGGTAGFWRHLQVRPAHLTLVNIVDRGAEGMRSIVGDACDPPEAALDREYDLIISNSVIDQVGGLKRRRQLAARISELADRYWVQTANRGFVLDAYFLFPGFAQLPVDARVAILRRWKLTHMYTTDRDEARRRVRSIELQSRDDMRELFPDASLIVERFAGIAKSLVAVRTARSAVPHDLASVS